ncbi:hypothetical protein PHMEG_00039065 [Phytophthora megakarya]|uniref:PiggyBac transposable element-derived protein domain-containing protein n=1 Tax=Phytophthora megakarya TaxID=4795 RepID=A0A225UGD2_9STRA|nr:hypothetical protein PHMEG_00039065 [Phytophthora megakarya]
MYLTGTIQTDKSGYAQGVVTSKKFKTVNKRQVMVPPQGTVKFAENKGFPIITAAMYMDRNLVHMLSSGGSRKEIQVSKRRLSSFDGRWRCPSKPSPGCSVTALQLAYKSRKYYKTLFLSLLDMAIVNAFIVHLHYKK